MRLLPVFFLMVAAGATVTALSTTQDPKQDPSTRPSTAHEPIGKPSASEADGLLATWLMVDSNNEVALAQLAQQKAQDPEVKQFAQKMMDEHRQMTQKLQPFASSVGVAGLSRDTTTPGQARTEPDTGRPRDAGSSRDVGGFDHVGLIEELGAQCLSSTRKELESKAGADFDRCYMGAMVGAHMKANDMLTVFQRHSSSQLKSVLADGQKTVAAHLQHAKDLSKKLDETR